ncbi:MAG: head decoration protein [Alistipes sp.]
MTVTNIDTGSVILVDARFSDEVLTLAGAATVKAGTILARDSVTNKLVLFVKGGSTNGNGIPKAIITYEVVATGAGDTAIRAGISGAYRKSRCVIHADGNDTNIDAVVQDQLRDYGLRVASVKELGLLDNQ